MTPKTITKYKGHYRHTATLFSAITKKGHFQLITLDNLDHVLLKIYADKDFTEEVAVFQKQPDHTWTLVRQKTPETKVTYQRDEVT